MKLYSYVIVADTGFAPNPYGGYVTLATCKPKIRKSAQPGDWIVGTGSVGGVGAGRLVYAMLVDQVISIEEYGSSPAHVAKRPDVRGNTQRRVGDNIYFKNAAGEWQQRESLHTAEHVERDLSGRNCLIGREFYYFGNNAVRLPDDLRVVANDGHPGHRCRFEPEVVERLVAWLRGNHKPGIHGRPFNSDSCAKQQVFECEAAAVDSDEDCGVAVASDAKSQTKC